MTKKEEIRVSYRLDSDLYEAVRKAAYEERRSQKKIVEEALALFFSQPKKNKQNRVS